MLRDRRIILSCLPVAADDVFVAVELLEPHRAAGVELLGRNAHLAAEAELAAVGKAGGGVYIDGGRVHQAGKLFGVSVVFGEEEDASTRRVNFSAFPSSSVRMASL